LYDLSESATGEYNGIEYLHVKGKVAAVLNQLSTTP
jgi:hypothetical protein